MNNVGDDGYESAITTLMIEVAVISKVLYYLIQLQLTALHSAAVQGQVEAVQLLIAAGADVNALDQVSINFVDIFEFCTHTCR